MTYCVDLEIIKCNGCGRLGVSLKMGDSSSQRITSHKCGGSWTTVSVQPGLIDTADIRRARTSALRLSKGKARWVKRRKAA
jgi:hypothetical protein